MSRSRRPSATSRISSEVTSSPVASVISARMSGPYAPSPPALDGLVQGAQRIGPGEGIRSAQSCRQWRIGGVRNRVAASTASSSRPATEAHDSVNKARRLQVADGLGPLDRAPSISKGTFPPALAAPPARDEQSASRPYHFSGHARRMTVLIADGPARVVHLRFDEYIGQPGIGGGSRSSSRRFTEGPDLSRKRRTHWGTCSGSSCGLLGQDGLLSRFGQRRPTEQRKPGGNGPANQVSLVDLKR